MVTGSKRCPRERSGRRLACPSSPRTPSPPVVASAIRDGAHDSPAPEGLAFPDPRTSAHSGEFGSLAGDPVTASTGVCGDTGKGSPGQGPSVWASVGRARTVCSGRANAGPAGEQAGHAVLRVDREVTSGPWPFVTEVVVLISGLTALAKQLVLLVLNPRQSAKRFYQECVSLVPADRGGGERSVRF